MKQIILLLFTLISGMVYSQYTHPIDTCTTAKSFFKTMHECAISDPPQIHPYYLVDHTVFNLYYPSLLIPGAVIEACYDHYRAIPDETEENWVIFVLKPEYRTFYIEKIVTPYYEY